LSCRLTFELTRPSRRGALGPRRTMEPATALRGPRAPRLVGSRVERRVRFAWHQHKVGSLGAPLPGAPCSAPACRSKRGLRYGLPGCCDRRPPHPAGLWLCSDSSLQCQHPARCSGPKHHSQGTRGHFPRCQFALAPKTLEKAGKACSIRATALAGPKKLLPMLVVLAGQWRRPCTGLLGATSTTDLVSRESNVRAEAARRGRGPWPGARQCSAA
jgi:hypothetical protein